MAEEIKQRITIEADEAIARLKAVTGLEYELATKVEQAGDASAKSAAKTDQLNKEMSLGEMATRRFTASMAAFAATGAGVKWILGEINGEFVKYRDQINKVLERARGVGEASRQLSGALGAPHAATVRQRVNEESRRYSLSPQQRLDLLRGSAAYADLTPGASPETVRSYVSGAAALASATGVGGEPAARMIAALSKVPGVGTGGAADAAAAMITSGMSPEEVSQMASRFGSAGGESLIGTVLAARQFGLAGDTQRRVLGFLGSLDQRDDRGRLARPLRAAGLSDRQSLVQRLETLAAGRAAGTLSEATFLTAIGGVGNMGVAEALMAGAQARQPLDIRFLGRLQQRQKGDPYIRVADTKAAVETRAAIQQEGIGAAWDAIQIEDWKNNLREQGLTESQIERITDPGLFNQFRAWAQGYTKYRDDSMGGSPPRQDRMQKYYDSLRQNPGRPWLNVIQTQINTGVNPHTDVRPPEVP
jgi:hypothetical protein